MRCLLTMCVVLWLVALTGCTRDFRTDGDALRARIMDLEREVERLDRRNRELEAELRRATRTGEIPEDIAENTPRVVEVVIARFSHARDTTGDGNLDEARLYIHTLDGRGRFTQVAGELTILAMILPLDADMEPITAGRITLSPADLRDTYRSSFMGTHYTVSVPLTMSGHAANVSEVKMEQIFVRVIFVDGLTGLTHTAERTLRSRP